MTSTSGRLVGVVRYTLNSGSDSRISHTPKSGYIRSIGNHTVKERRRIPG
jgi:hypothetical protein